MLFVQVDIRRRDLTIVEVMKKVPHFHTPPE